ncbi:MAG: response regulator [Desulfamplus sp.]|nr:response regulator [Desulfamplus sp.]
MRSAKSITRWSVTKSIWQRMNISYKFGIAFGLLLILIIIVALTGYIALRSVSNAERSIHFSGKIQQLVLEMDRGMERARRLTNTFFLIQHLIGFENARKKYVEPSIKEIERVLKDSLMLKAMLSTSDLEHRKSSYIEPIVNIKPTLEKKHIDLNRYLSFANRFSETTLESVKLATQLFLPEKGLEARFDRCFENILSEFDTLTSEFNTKNTSSDIDSKVSYMKQLAYQINILGFKYRISRQRFLMQSAFNLAFTLKDEIFNSIYINQVQRQKLIDLTEQWLKIAEEIVSVDVQLKGKMNDFSIQADAVDLISKTLVKLAEEELKKSSAGITNSYLVSTAIIIMVTFIGICFAILIFQILNVSITKRVTALTDMAAAFRQNNMQFPINNADEPQKMGGGSSENVKISYDEDGSDELGQLNRTFNLMAMRIDSLVNDLEEKVEQRTSELIESQKRLHRAEKMEAVGVLAAGVAHDLNNILSGVIGYPEIILMQLPEGSDLEPPVRAMMESGQRAASVVADLLTLARGAANSRNIENLNELILQYLDSPEFQKLQESNFSVEYNTHLAPDCASISCSGIHIIKTIMNLMMNAEESINGLGSVSISTRNELIDEEDATSKGVAQGTYTVLNVTDTGKGISDNDLKHIFEPFYTRKVMGKSGTGLGLTVVWNTVQDHNGTIVVKSSSNGTSFDLYFPSIEPASLDKINSNDKKERYSKNVELLRGNGQKILVVDDEPCQIDVATRMLTILNYEVVSVESGEKAVEYLKSNRVDMVLLDMIMAPGINGRETYEQIVQTNPLQKAIIASGFSESEDVKMACQMGIGGYLKKPYSIEQLSRAVASVL